MDFGRKEAGMNIVQQLAIEQAREAAAAVASNLRVMPPDRQTWKPMDAGRSALELVQECAVLNRFFAAAIRDGKAPEWSWDAYKGETARLDTPDKALKALEDATDELVAAIESVAEADLDQVVSLPFAEGFTVPMRDLLFFATKNMTYHHGQIAYIQTLYGDYEMH